MSTLISSLSSRWSISAPRTATLATTARSLRQALWHRWCRALLAAHQRRAEREIGALVARHGGLLTDDIEREILRYMAGRPH